MSFDLNVIIFLSFLIINLALGLWSSRGVTNIREYAVGNRDFNTGTLVAAIVALWVSGEFFATIVTESYKDGLIFMSILVANVLGYILVGVFFAPRLHEFLGKISIAEAMGELYGNRVRVITAISGFIGVSGIIAIQLQIAGLLFEYALGISGAYGIIISGIIITLYSSLGGIKAVTFTDVIQFLTFGIVIPSIGLMLFAKFGNESVIDILSHNPKFSFSESFSFSNSKIYYFASLFLWLLIPHFKPADFQRISMAKDVTQVRHSFVIAAFVGAFLAAVICWIAMLLLSKYPNLEGDDILRFIVVEYQWVNGFKGLIIAGLMAMIMSTVDSLINSNAVLLIHDLRQPLRLKFIQNELLSTRVCAAIIGVIAILFALRGGNFFELIVWTSTMYMPIVTVPFIMTLLGFRSSGNSVVAGMIAGFVTVVIWEGMHISQHMAGIGALIPAIISNLVVLLGYHYSFNQKGGWVGIKDPTILEDLKKEKIKKRVELIYSIKNFNFINFLKSTTPKNEGVIALLGVSIIVLIFISAASLTTELRVAYKEIIEVSYISTLFFTASLISYPVWDSKWKGKTFIAICWNVTIFYVLACFGFFMVLLSNFGDMQMIIYMVSVLLIVSIMDWRWSLAVLVVGMAVVSSMYKVFIMPELIIKDISYELKILYIIFMVVGVVIAFLKPKQEYVEATEAKVGTLEFKVTDLGHEIEERGHKIVDLNEKVTYFEEKIEDQAKEIERLGATAQRILNNLNHELRIPVGNVMNFSEMLAEGLGKYNESQLKMLSDEVHKNSNRLSTMILNMLDLATLNATKIKLQKKTINLGDLVEERVKRCRKIYLQGKLINFKLEIESELLIMIDPNYMRQVVDNLVINAINFSKKGLIEVSVRKQKDNVVITVTDEGIGVPKNEKYDIFTPFKMGSNAESKAEGRGVGLALCKTAIEEHGGQISVNSENGKTIFRVVLPM